MIGVHRRRQSRWHLPHFVTTSNYYNPSSKKLIIDEEIVINTITFGSDYMSRKKDWKL
jgi:hypothetical protein